MSTTQHNAAQPIVRWTGGKTKSLPALLACFPEKFGDYHEPFFGGGALFFELWNRDQRAGLTRQYHINDANEKLIAMYRAVAVTPSSVTACLRELMPRHSVEQYYEIRTKYNDENWQDVEAARFAAWFIYLNKTGFNGLYRTNRSGGFNTPVGRNARKQLLRPDMARISHLLDAASPALKPQGGTNIHAPGSYTKAVSYASPGDLVYFDPPYDPDRKGGFTAYVGASFRQDAQSLLALHAANLLLRGVHVVISNHDTDLVRSLYSDGDKWRFTETTESRTGRAKKNKAKALIIVGRPAVGSL